MILPRALRVGFDGRALTSPAAGVRRYVRELFGAMAEVDPDILPIALGASSAADLPGRSIRSNAPWHLPTNFGWSVTGIPCAARRAAIDVYHAPAYTAPRFGVHPLVLTIHDVSYARHPEWYPYRRDPVRRWFYRSSARAADVIIADSEFSRGEIVAAYGIDIDRIVVIPLGVGPEFTPGPTPDPRPPTPDPRPPTPDPRLVRRSFSEGGSPLPPYVLHVGDLHARRNLLTALAAVLRVRARVSPLQTLRLVLSGTDRGVGEQLVLAARDAGQADAVELIDSADDRQLVSLYRGASAFLYPSRYEGFGLPLVEAMACGVPIIAARAGSIPEVVGSAGVLIDPDDEQGFAEALEGMLTNHDLAARSSQASRERAALFTWQRTARETVKVYRQSVDEPVRRL